MALPYKLHFSAYLHKIIPIYRPDDDFGGTQLLQTLIHKVAQIGLSLSNIQLLSRLTWHFRSLTLDQRAGGAIAAISTLSNIMFTSC